MYVYDSAISINVSVETYELLDTAIDTAVDTTIDTANDTAKYEWFAYWYCNIASLICKVIWWL